jgi:AsmA-like C-terminal region
VNKPLRYGLLGFGVLIVAAGIFISFYLKTLNLRLKARVLQALEERFDADVDLKTLDVSIFPQPTVEGEDLRIRHHGWDDAHPLIAIHRFRATTDFLTLAATRDRVSLVNLEGLEIHLPPRDTGKPSSLTAYKKGSNQLRFLIQTIVAKDTLLEIEPKKAGKDPLRFHLKELTLHSVGPGKAMSFVTKLTNAKPPGLIDSTGHFGPWGRDDPRSTPVSGDYTFQHADLGVFTGISGILSSTGEYHGQLQHIEVNGKTDVPDFSLQPKGDPVHLTTQFHSIVDGTNGDTVLDPVDATFLQSEFVCRGGVVQQNGPRGKTVSLDAVAKHARIEDILKLVIGGKKPVLTGGVNFTAKIEIPPGHERVIEKLKLDGRFALQSASFTNPNVQRRLNELSERARGISKHEADNDGVPTATVASDLQVKFKLNRGTARFERISFRVPAALVDLAGTFNLGNDKIDLNGKFAMQATLSDTQSGIKHWLLKPFDPVFKKDGQGFEVPLTIAGTKDEPEVGTRLFHKKVQIH